MTSVVTVDELWLGDSRARGQGAWRGPTAIAVEPSGFRLATDRDPRPAGHLAATLLPGFHDAHVHLGLVDGTALLAGGVASVDDFGWSLDLAQTWPHDPALPEVTIAGQLLTAAGGYPTASGWAPPDASLEISGPEEAPGAVARQVAAGARFLKIALNSEAGPVLDDATLGAVVASAHASALPVAAHAQGAGQAARAFEAGVDVLAHTPWTERLSDELIEAMAGRMSWVSTLDIHGWGDYGDDFARASDNLARFNTAGGSIRYGTDLGNGPLPLGINERELRALEDAGLGLDALVAAIAPHGRAAASASTAASASAGLGRRLSLLRTASPGQERGDAAAWLATAQLIDPHTLEEHLT